MGTTPPPPGRRLADRSAAAELFTSEQVEGGRPRPVFGTCSAHAGYDAGYGAGTTPPHRTAPTTTPTRLC